MNKSKLQSPILFIVLSLLINLNGYESAARLIKIPLSRKTTQTAGTVGQPVISYYAPVTVGTPPVTLNIQFDVGFGDLFVPHYLWNPFKTYLHYSKGFQCKASSSCKKVDQSMTIAYQSCKLTGKPYEDIITFTSAYGDNATITQSDRQKRNATYPVNYYVQIRQNFLAISDASDARFKDLPVDGFFGLGPMAQSSSSINNILISLHNARLIDNLQFSLWFNPVLDSSQGGELVLGGIDTSRYQGQIYWHHLSSMNNQWAIGLQLVSLGGQVVSCYGQPCQAVISSGVNEVYGPREDVQRIYNLLNTSHQSSGLELVDCRRISSLPILTFNIDGIPYALLPSNYIRKTVDGVLFKTETCYVAILPSYETQKWVLGTNFLGAYYSIFDMTYRQVGFASLR